jgi:YjbE family integral membrane protein
MFSGAEISAFFQVVMVDLVLAGDNAIVVGLVAAGVADEHRRRVIAIGIVAAAVMRVAFALVTVQLLQILGLILAGGLLLLWVCWKLWRELHHGQAQGGAAKMAARQPKTVASAIFQIVVADISMSLDNVLAVAGAAREHPWILAFGLALSVALMALAATYIARLLDRHRWIAYVGLLVILYVALRMIWEGTMEIVQAAGLT